MKFTIYVKGVTKGSETRQLADGTTIEQLREIEPGLNEEGIVVLSNGAKVDDDYVISEGDVIVGSSEDKGGSL